MHIISVVKLVLTPNRGAIFLFGARERRRRATPLQGAMRARRIENVIYSEHDARAIIARLISTTTYSDN